MSRKCPGALVQPRRARRHLAAAAAHASCRAAAVSRSGTRTLAFPTSAREDTHSAALGRLRLFGCIRRVRSPSYSRGALRTLRKTRPAALMSAHSQRRQRSLSEVPSRALELHARRGRRAELPPAAAAGGAVMGVVLSGSLAGGAWAQATPVAAPLHSTPRPFLRGVAGSPHSTIGPPTHAQATSDRRRGSNPRRDWGDEAQ